MGTIYASASKVVVWLGEADDDTLQGMIALESLGRWAWDKTHPEVKIDFARMLELAQGNRAWELDWWVLGRQAKVLSVTKRDWFKRAWTLQEICLSSDAEICCGPFVLPWRIFVQAWLAALELNMESMLFATGTVGRKGLHSMFLFWLLFDGRAAGTVDEWYRLSRLLHLNQFRESTDPRDVIFSLLGLAKSGDGTPYPVDYSLSVEEVFTQYSKRIIIEDNNLAILSSAERTLRSPLLPSWVVDWRSKPRTHPFFELGGYSTCIYNVWKGLSVSFRSQLNNGTTTLALQGTLIDRVRSAHSLDSLAPWMTNAHELRGYPWREIMLAMRAFFTIDLQLNSTGRCPTTGESNLTAFLRTLTADRFPSSTRLSDQEKLEQFPQHYCFVRNPHWLTSPWQVIRKLGIMDYSVPETAGIKLTRDPKEAVKHAARAARGGDPLLNFIPRSLRHWIVDRSEWKLGKKQHLGSTATTTEFAVQKADAEIFYTGLMKAATASWPVWVGRLSNRFKRLDEMILYLHNNLGFRRIASHRTEILMDLNKSISRAITGRKFFVTENGRMGLGPDDMSPGDEVFCLAGSPVPYVLTAFGEEHRLVGECYVHGIMDGELWDGQGAGGVTPEFHTLTLI